MFGATIYKDHQNQKLRMTVGGANIFVHEDYTEKPTLNDIAVIKLDIPLPLSTTKNSKMGSEELIVTPSIKISLF